MRFQRRTLGLERLGDVDPRIRGVRPADEDLLHLVWREALGDELGKDADGLRRREDGIERGARDRAVIRMVHVLVAVIAHGRIAADHDVRPVTTDDAREIAPKSERGLDDAILVPEQGDVLDAENARRLVQLSLTRGNEALAARRVLVGPRPARGYQTEHDRAAFSGPFP